MFITIVSSSNDKQACQGHMVLPDAAGQVIQSHLNVLSICSRHHGPGQLGVSPHTGTDLIRGGS